MPQVQKSVQPLESGTLLPKAAPAKDVAPDTSKALSGIKAALAKHKKPVTETLRKALKILSQRDAWCQGYYVTNKKHKSSLKYEDSMADQFCALGAIGKASGYTGTGWRQNFSENRAAQILAEAIGADGDPYYVPSWNDRGGRTKKEILAGFKKAIKIASERGE